ncbi:MAG: hypothetical protein J6N21_22180, partial [Butyrivibrio sp.]|nr:hypothetical protein [Butyrivibrio sp.]
MEKIAAMNVANAAMGAASLVVGQYYMQQINAELSAINDGISKIQDFLQDNYKSKVRTLVTQVKRAADFQIEIMEDATLRAEEITRLQSLEKTCMELLNQANETIERASSKQYDAFDKYSEATATISEWQKYQMLLVNVLYTIADLDYTFHLGAKSHEQCYRAYDDTFRYTENTIEKTKKWHLTHEKSLGIDVDQAIFERKGIDAIIHKPLALIKYILKRTTDENSIVLDFFSGSATTAHATMLLNAEDCLNREYIMIQLPEKIEDNKDALKEGYATICDIGKERIRRAGAKIKRESPLLAQNLDIGFRVFKLDESNMNDVYYAAGDYTQDLLTMLESNVKS